MAHGGREVAHRSAARQLHRAKRRIAVRVRSARVALRTVAAPERRPEVVLIAQLRGIPVAVRCNRVERPRVVRTQRAYDLRALLPPTPALVAKREHRERRMVAVGVDDPLRFGEAVGAQFRIPREVPSKHAELRLHDESCLVGGLERRLRRTPRVEAYVVESVLLQSREVLPPRLHLHRRGTGERPHARIMPPTQKHRTPVQRELRTLRAEVAKAELHRGRRLARFDRERMQHWIELAPLRRIRAEHYGKLARRYAARHHMRERPRHNLAVVRLLSLRRRNPHFYPRLPRTCAVVAEHHLRRDLALGG